MSVFARGFVTIGTCDVMKTSVHLGKDADRNDALLAWEVLMAVQWAESGLLYQTDSGLCQLLTV